MMTVLPGPSNIAALIIVSGILLSGCRRNDPAEKEEEYSGGREGTVFVKSADAFGQPFIHLTHDEIRQFQLGNSLNRNNWVAAPSTTTARDGLGPLFNASSCAGCHVRDGRGLPFNSNGTPAQSILFRLSVPGQTLHGRPVPEPQYGSQFNHQSLPGVKPEGKVSVHYTEIPGQYPDGTPYVLRRPRYDFTSLEYGPLHAETMVSPRVAPHMAGMGLLDAVTEATILAQADPGDKDLDGISGRPNYVWDVKKQQKVIGKFGWKANEPTVMQQTASAFAGDMGITSSLFPEEDLSPSQSRHYGHLPKGGSPEIDDESLEDVVFYIRTLAVPARREWDQPEILKGKQLFSEAGCASCHLPRLITGPDATPSYLANQTIRPYTDMLLHDMGEALADGRPDGEASGSEWRTAPLWGIGLLKTVNKHTLLLHDGRARSVEEAILWHGGEAAAARQNFMNLTKKDRELLLKFVNSL